MVQSHLRYFTRLQLFSMRGLGIAVGGAQAILKPNGNRNRVINSKCEWTFSTKSLKIVWLWCIFIIQIEIGWDQMNDGDAFLLDVGKAIYVWNGLSASGTEKRKVREHNVSYMPTGQQVSHQRGILGFRWTRPTKHASKGMHPGFQPRRDVSRSHEQGVSVAPTKVTNCPPKFFLKKENVSTCWVLNSNPSTLQISANTCLVS